MIKVFQYKMRRHLIVISSCMPDGGRDLNLAVFTFNPFAGLSVKDANGINQVEMDFKGKV